MNTIKITKLMIFVLPFMAHFHLSAMYKEEVTKNENELFISYYKGPLTCTYFKTGHMKGRYKCSLSKYNTELKIHEPIPLPMNLSITRFQELHKEYEAQEK